MSFWQMEEMNESSAKKDPQELREWCEQSIEQLNLSAALIAQCLDSDIHDINKQNAVLEQCLREVESLRKFR